MKRLDGEWPGKSAFVALAVLSIGLRACSDKTNDEPGDAEVTGGSGGETSGDGGAQQGGQGGEVQANPDEGRDLGTFARCELSGDLDTSATLLLDDFEQGLRTVGSQDGSWFSFSDGSNGTFTWETTESEAQEGSLLHVRSSNFGEWSGFGLEVSGALGQASRCALDAHEFKGIRFVARGSGELRVRASTVGTVPSYDGGTCPNGEACYDQPGAFVHLTSEPQLVELPFCGMRIQGLYDAEPAHFDAAEFVGLNFIIQSYLQEGDVEIWIDDLELYTDDATKTEADCDRHCPLQSTRDLANVVPDQSYLELSSELTVSTFEQGTTSCGKLTRRYLSYVPQDLDTSTDAPVVMFLHGHGANAESVIDFQTRGRLNELAHDDGFVVVYGNAAPGYATSANPNFPNTGAWRQSTDDDGEVDDVDYIKLVLADLEKRELISGDNDIFLAGHSNGGGMALKAASFMSERLSGIALFMPYVGSAALPLSDLSDSPLSHVLFVHAPGDPGLPLDHNAILAEQPLLWAQALQLSTIEPTVTPLVDVVDEGADYTGDSPVVLATQDSSVVQTDYQDKGAKAAVRDLSIKRGGHFLPNAAQDTDEATIEAWGLRNQDIDASEVMWAFFKTREVK